MASAFAINLAEGDEKLAEDFRLFIQAKGIAPEEAARIVSDFRASALPQIGRLRSITGGGSNVNFSRVFNTSVGPITVALDTAPKSLISRFIGIFGR